MNFGRDESLLIFYESVRRQVDADRYERYRFTGKSVKEYAERLREEMNRRRLRFTPIEWPPEEPSRDSLNIYRSSITSQ
jgi:hypothetical protein